MYTLQNSESKNGKIIRYETIAIYKRFVDAYQHYVNLLLQDDSGMYCYRILEGKKIIEDSRDLTPIFETREACKSCAYNDELSCSCFEPSSICCPYVKEGD